jgi:ActR/RegA family two-component response regulator
MLKEAGYRTLTANNMSDALILLKATRPKTVVIGAELREASSSHMAEEFNSIASAGTIIELPTGFSEQDAGDAAQHVLQVLRVGGRT